jgi:hypothetical protein
VLLGAKVSGGTAGILVSVSTTAARHTKNAEFGMGQFAMGLSEDYPLISYEGYRRSF